MGKVVNFDYLSKLVSIKAPCTNFTGKIGRELNQYMRLENYNDWTVALVAVIATKETIVLQKYLFF